MRKICLSLLMIFSLCGIGCSCGDESGQDAAKAQAEQEQAAAQAGETEADDEAASDDEKPVASPETAEGIQTVRVEIQGSLEGSLRKVLDGTVASPLSQVTARMLVWWVDLAKDLRAGDSISIAYEIPKNHEPILHAVRFTTGKLNKTFRAYRFQPKGQPFPHFFDETGAEIEQTLKDGPIDNYDQITSILKDGRKHKGVDFRAPVGTPVKLPFAATLMRKNWKFKGNGNCLDFQDGKGRHIIFLHLEALPEAIKVGQHFAKGAVVAKSGNSGRSFAPHLHYQLEDSSGTVLDPFEVHETYRKKVPSNDLVAFEKAVQSYDEMLDKAD